MTFDTLTPKQQKFAVSLLQREERKSIARDKLYAEIRSKNEAWYASRSKK